ncbi:MAG: pilus assembly protein TadG-related protein [Candidatus Limnocylindrales bacterium]
MRTLRRTPAASHARKDDQPATPQALAAGRPRLRERGQVLAIFAASIFLFVAILAVVIDVSWYWANSLRVQRAADAAALAGVVWLPGAQGTAYSTARAEAVKNGYTNGAGGITVTPVQDSVATPGGNPRQLDVTVSAPVNTFFMRLFGINTLTASRRAKAEYVQPVPMGSPQNYYGVYQLCNNSGTCSNLPNATGAGSLASQGFFGAIEGQGSNRSTGDAFATNYNPRTTVNAQYDPGGYYYQVNVPQNGGNVYVFDPTFCATVAGAGGGHLGAGDHWINSGSVDAVPVSTYFRLWDTKNTLFTSQDDTLVATSGNLFANEFQVDKSATYGNSNNGNYAGYADGNAPVSPSDCQSSPYHNRWWLLSAGLPAGTYFVQVMTTDPGNANGNNGQMFENMWSLEVTGGGNPAIYGFGRMVSYANIQSGNQEFFLAQIDRTAGAGKTIELDLFDAGDVGDKAWVQILDPDGNVYTPATFSWSQDGNGTSPQSLTNQTCIQSFANGSAITPPAGCPNFGSGGQFFQNSWITVLIPLPASYGSAGLTPADPGNPTNAPGWWKIRYTVNKGNDTTTWMVNIRGNPVHLVVP